MESHPEFIDQLPPTATGLECVILHNDKYAATIRFRDMLREESKSFISHLGHIHQFNRIMLVSGDRESKMSYLGKLLNLTEIYASQIPQEKLSIVRSEMKKAATLFMGDGINDAPALTAATVGIAFGQYSNVTAAAAGAVIMESTLQKVDGLIHISLATRKIVLQSAVGGMLLSLIGMGFAAAGFITPVAGAILQEIIDIAAIIDVNLYVAYLTPQRSIDYTFQTGRNGWLQLIKGRCNLNGQPLSAGDGAAIQHEKLCHIHCIEASEFLLFDLSAK